MSAIDRTSGLGGMPAIRVRPGLFLRGIASLIVSLSLSSGFAADFNQELSFKIPSQPLSSALLQFAEQSKLQVLTASTDLTGYDSPGVEGLHTVRAALEAILSGTGLSYRRVGEGTVTIARGKNAHVPTSSAAGNAGSQTSGSLQLAQVDSSTASGGGADQTESGGQELPAAEETGKAMPEVLVLAGKSLNMDIKRTEDDVQPYVIFDRAMIERSGATNAQEFLKQRLTMNTIGQTNGQQSAAVNGNLSSINLRGLGANQTLILIDGHRVASPKLFTLAQQSDLNGIPLAAIERIEVLPTTASGMYGGGATGGVINIILRRDYEGIETKVTYDNTFETDSAIRRLEIGAGFTLDDGKTNILLAGGYSDSNPLLVADRDFLKRGREAIQDNNPASLLPPNVPPLGATPNIRSAASGVNLVLDNGTPLNAQITHVPVGYAGTTDQGIALVANAGRYNLEPAHSAQLTGGGGGQTSLLNAATVKSLMATLRREFTPRLHAFLELAAADSESEFRFASGATTYAIAANAPTNPFLQNIQVTVPTSAGDGATTWRAEDRRVVCGLILRLPHEWSAEADYTWNTAEVGYSQPSSFAPNVATDVNNGTLDVLRDTNLFPVDFSSYLRRTNGQTPLRTTLKDSTFRVAGPIGTLPGGPLTVSMLLEYREESFDEATLIQPSPPDLFLPARSQSVKSAYIEGRLPIVSSANRLPGIRELELQIAGRRDEYTVHGATDSVATGSTTPIVEVTNRTSSTDPTVGLRYQPLQDVTLRASFGTGFLPPSVAQVTPTLSATPITLEDPQRGGTSFTLPPGQVRSGGNSNLQPEESESWSAGVILTPRLLTGSRLSVDYTKIEKTDNIANFPGGTQALINSGLFPERITRGANQPGDLPGWAGPITFIDASLFNIARTEVEAYDVQLDQRVETAAAGTFDFFAVTTWQTHFQTQILSTQPLLENVGVSSSNPLKFKATAGLSWTFRDWTIAWNARHFDSYRLTNTVQVISQGDGGVVPSQTYHDVLASYRFGEAPRLAQVVKDAQIQFGVRNVFDELPPFDASLTTFYSPFGDPRLRSYYVTVKMGF